MLSGETQGKIVQQLWKASTDKYICRISLKDEPLPRLVHPYGVGMTTAKKIILVSWQEGGFTKGGGKAGYRNLILDRIQEVEILEKRFYRRDDFDPDDGQYKEWIYHI